MLGPKGKPYPQPVTQCSSGWTRSWGKEEELIRTKVWLPVSGSPFCGHEMLGMEHGMSKWI